MIIRVKSALLAAAISCAYISPLHAQVASDLGIFAVDKISEGNTALTINAKGKVVGQPDMAVFTVDVTSTAETASEALRENSARMQKVLSELKKQGFADRDLQTSNLSITPVMSGDTDGLYEVADSAAAKAPHITGYSISNSLKIRQRKLGGYGKMIDLIVSAGANTIRGPSFEISAPDSAIDEARRLAIAEANRRAKLYADAANMRVVRMVMIDEAGVSGLSSDDIYAYAAVPEESNYAPIQSGMPIQSGALEITAKVNILFELAPNR